MNVWLIIAASGIGARMQSDVPKQYQILFDRTVIEHTIFRLTSAFQFKKIIVSIAENDNYWSELPLNDQNNIDTVSGGKYRCHSVLNALAYIEGQAELDDWVLVHDAVRPCIHHDDINNLLQLINNDKFVGAVLGRPISHTVKKINQDDCIEVTLQREHLWAAFTPQLFPYGLLLDSLRSAIKSGVIVTDEAAAIERAGYQPIMIQGRSDNIKITYPEDLILAKWYLNQQAVE